MPSASGDLATDFRTFVSADALLADPLDSTSFAPHHHRDSLAGADDAGTHRQGEATSGSHANAAPDNHAATSTSGAASVPNTATTDALTLMGLASLRSVAQVRGQPAPSPTAPSAPSFVSVNATWAGLAPGTHPDGAPAGAVFGVNAFATVQQGIDAVAAGGTVDVAPGTSYRESLRLTKNVTLQDPGGQATIYSGPVVTDPYGQKDIIYVGGGATVNFDGITVQGPGPGPFASIDYGIFVGENVTLNLSNSSVLDIRDEPLSGMQTGVGVGREAVGAVGHAAITNCTISDYQKGGAVADGPGSTMTISGCTVQGVGPTDVIAGNGIQASRGAFAAIVGNTVRGNTYTPGSYVATDVLLYNPAPGTTVSDNTLTAADVGVYDAAGDAGTTVANNTATGDTYGVISGTNGTAASMVSGNTLSNNTTGIYAYSNGAAPTTITGNALTSNATGLFVGQGNVTASNNTIQGSGSETGVVVGSITGNTLNSVATVTSNTLRNLGTAIALQNDSASNPVHPELVAHFNRIVGDIVGVDNPASSGGSADAALNWWGKNTGPNDPGTGPNDPPTPTTTGADVSAWLVLTLTATPDHLRPGDTANVVADLRHDSAGAVHTEGFVPDGIPVQFAANSGSVPPANTATAQGRATATYTAPSAILTDQVSATVDQQKVTSLVYVNPLVAVNDSYSVLEDGTLKVDAAQGLLANDFDLNGLKFAVLDPQAYRRTQHGTLKVREDGSLTYSPDPGYIGPDSFAYQDRELNGQAVSGVALVLLQVNAKQRTERGEITGLNSPTGSTAPPAVPGNSRYQFQVSFFPLKINDITDVHWRVYDEAGQNFVDPSIAAPLTDAGEVVRGLLPGSAIGINQIMFGKKAQEVNLRVAYYYSAG